MKVIGHGRLVRELDGWRLAATENRFMRVIGKGIAGGLSMTTAGTENVKGIVVGIATITTNEARF